MSDHQDHLLAFQPDIYQRYAFLAGLIRSLVDIRAGDVTILDVGCGPLRLTETFLGSRIRVVRADVDQFGDPEIVLITPRQPLPFATGEFDLALALDVLEHVPAAERADAVRELERVARIAAIVSCPVATPDVVEAERTFSEAARVISGRDIDFLREHRLFGLPDENDVASWFGPAAELLITENVPLDEWLALNLFDLIYAADFADTDAKARVDAALNAGTRFRRSGAPHYRRFFCAVKEPGRAAAAAKFIEQSGQDVSPSSLGLIRRVTSAVVRLREDLRARAAAERTAKDAIIGELDQLLARAKEDANAQADALRDRETRMRLLDEHLESVRRTLEQKEERVAALDAQIEAARSSLVEREAQVEGLDDALKSREADLSAMRDELAAVRAHLQAVLSSRSWRLTAGLRGLRLVVARSSQAQHRRTQSIRRRWHLWRYGRRVRQSGLFDAQWYLARNADVAAARLDPLKHYLLYGGTEGRDPNPLFDSSFYLESSPDVAAAGLNPLVHFVRWGKAEGRRPRPAIAGPAATPSGAVPTHSFYVPPQGLLPWFNPLNLAVSQPLSSEPRLNVLLPGLGMRHLSGGPNTALALAARLARAGIRVRLMSTEAALDADRQPLWAHIRGLLGTEMPSGVELVDAHDRSSPTAIGDRDVFLATAWWTAQQAKYAIKLTKHRRFVYLIQDYEPLMHPASTQQALANETYGLDHIPVVNSRFLAEFLVQQRVGRFADAEFAQQAVVFDPAVDRAVFHPPAHGQRGGRRRLLFYARPTKGLRNLFELGVAALQRSIADGTLDPAVWDFVAMGEPIAPVPLGSGAILTPAPWVDLHGYARQMRDSDLLLSLMLSPHPSYPPLEMAASGGLVVTTEFETKTAARMSRVSANILVVAPTVEAVAEGLARARARVGDWDARIAGAKIDLPGDWDESFAYVVPALVTRLGQLQGSPALPSGGEFGGSSEPLLYPGFRSWPAHDYDLYRRDRLAKRVAEYPPLESPGLLSFLTPVWNTDPVHLQELAETVLGQDLQTNYEWVLLDNGSDRPETKAVLERIATDPRVRLYHSPVNLGIIGGTRYCLERASGRYAATVDHDDLLAPDCVRVLTHALAAHGFPACVYTDEDKVDEHGHRDPYFKPDWDPVLFSSSCYIAHLIAFDRHLALELGAYTDTGVEGSHDWDTFTRFSGAGLMPLHVPEILYTWRMHPSSTAGNFQSKPYVFRSQQRVLEKIVAQGVRPERFQVEPSPLFNGTPDWWIRRTPSEPRGVVTVVIGNGDAASRNLYLNPDVPHQLITVPEAHGPGALQDVAALCAEDGRLVHVLWADVEIENTDWPWEAIGLFERFPDAAVVGGRILRDGWILDAAGYFGFGRGCESPDRGRPAGDPGYFVQSWKPHSASSVPIQHCAVEPDFLADFLRQPAHQTLALRHLGAWLGAHARRQGRRVIYTPFFTARAGTDNEPSDLAWAIFRRVHADLMPETAYLSRRLGLDAATVYRGVPDETRKASLAANDRIDDALALEVDRATRRILYSSQARRTSFSLLTSVYVRTNPELFNRTSESLLSLSRSFDEWVLLVNGPIGPDLDRIVARLSTDPRVKVVREPMNLGIVGAMRRCLEAATCEYVLPMDADDLLEPDTLDVFEHVLSHETADLVYGDEAILSGDSRVATFSRPPFDPVLNLETSYIWHPCAFRRTTALELGAYSDANAEYCHDWDTLMRFAGAGAAIGHVPHILYHWRTHPNSLSHSGTQNQGSIQSSRHVLQRIVNRLARPDLYEVRPFPLHRGAEEWYIARHEEEDPPILALVRFTPDLRATDGGPSGAAEFPFQRTLQVSSRCSWATVLEKIAKDIGAGAKYIALARGGSEPLGKTWIWEAIRLHELHSDIAVVSGRVLDERGSVLDAGKRTGRWAIAMNDFVGLNRIDPGPFALALKPHSIDEPCEALLTISTEFLQSAIDVARSQMPSSLSQVLATAARLHHRRIVYSPLIEAGPRQWSIQPVGEQRRSGVGAAASP